MEKVNSCTHFKTQKGSGQGSHHWLIHRVLAVGLIWLGLWFAKFCITLTGTTQEEMLKEFQTPYNTTMLILFLSFSFYHGWLGSVEVIEDYIHNTCIKGSVKIILLFTMLFLFVLGLLAILKLFIS